MVFVTHCGLDEAVAKKLVTCLENSGIRCWFDGKDIGLGDSIPRKMSDGLAAAERLIVVWSRASKKSHHVNNEFEAFYMKYPVENRILFYRLDAVGIPCLYAARRYLDASHDFEEDCKKLCRWVRGRTLKAIQKAEYEPPAASELHDYPEGPMVDLQHIPPNLVQAYADALHTPAEADMVFEKANKMREDAEPPGTEGILINKGLIPLIAYEGAFGHWHKVFQEAFRHGPRMIAALLMVQPDDLFKRDARRERAELLEFLRSLAEERDSDETQHE